MSAFSHVSLTAQATRVDYTVFSFRSRFCFENSVTTSCCDATFNENVCRHFFVFVSGLFRTAIFTFTLFSSYKTNKQTMFRIYHFLMETVPFFSRFLNSFSSCCIFCFYLIKVYSFFFLCFSFIVFFSLSPLLFLLHNYFLHIHLQIFSFQI